MARSKKTRAREKKRPTRKDRRKLLLNLLDYNSDPEEDVKQEINVTGSQDNPLIIEDEDNG